MGFHLFGKHLFKCLHATMHGMNDTMCLRVRVYARRCRTVCDYLIDVLNLLMNYFGECERKTILCLALIELHTQSDGKWVDGTDCLFRYWNLFVCCALGAERIASGIQTLPNQVPQSALNNSCMNALPQPSRKRNAITNDKNGSRRRIWSCLRCVWINFQHSFVTI